MDSHQPEAAALFTAMVMVQQLLDENPPDPTSQPATRVKYVLNNKSVIDDLEWNFGPQTSVYNYLKPDYNILQAINNEQAAATRDDDLIDPSVSWVKGHQDDHTPREELSDAALANYYADKTCGIMHGASDDEAGLFPEWIPNLEAGLLHQGHLVTKKQEAHVITATTAPALQQSIMKDSKKRDPLIEVEWTDDTFNSVDWQANKSSFDALSPGKKIQISNKYTHEWTPTLQQ
jgi:hypothetical protein